MNQFVVATLATLGGLALLEVVGRLLTDGRRAQVSALLVCAGVCFGVLACMK